MIPILYDKDETAFVSNGLCRLRDAISVIVTEERNSIYELDMEYPVTGANYDLIQIGRIIGATHDESGDLQPFDIVSYTKPIDGVVTFHAVHISYRQSFMVVPCGPYAPIPIGIGACFGILKNGSYPSNPFTYWTNIDSTNTAKSFQGEPKTVRQILGGIEGSILDTYGGEYEWDKWTVKLWSARGQYRDFSIRYGVNMLDYNEEYDISGCYSSCIPYWTDGANTVVGNKQNSGGYTPTGRDQCIPLDVSEKFENQPTKTQVQNMGKSIMGAANSTAPAQTIEVSFVRLQDMGEYAAYQDLLQCRLCDTINVIFPDYNSSGTFKIVKTVWNVLTGKYDGMELGDLSVSLSEALGIERTGDSRTVCTDSSGNVTIPGKMTAFYQIYDYTVSVGAINAHTNQAAATYTSTEGFNPPDGYEAVGIVGWETGNYRIRPTSHKINSSHNLYAGFANTSATNVTSSTNVIFYILCLKATSA